MWGKDFFSDLYYELFLKKDKNQVKDIINRVINYSGLSKEKLILQQCCGVGDVLSEMHNLGYNIKGFDIQKNYVELGQNKFNLSPKLIFVADATSYFDNNMFDFVLNINNSFGYLSDKQNKEIILNAYKSLKNNGVYVLQLGNIFDVIRNFQKVITYEKVINNEKYLVIRNSDFDFETLKMKQNWKYFKNGTLFQERESDYQYYTPKEIKTFLQDVGFKEVKIFDENEKIISSNSKETIFIAKK